MKYARQKCGGTVWTATELAGRTDTGQVHPIAAFSRQPGTNYDASLLASSRYGWIGSAKTLANGTNEGRPVTPLRKHARIG